MAGQEAFLLEGGMTSGGLTGASASMGVGLPSGPGLSGSGDPRHGIIGLVLIAVLVLYVLDKSGFRFVFMAGRR